MNRLVDTLPHQRYSRVVSADLSEMVRSVVTLLVAGKFDELERITKGRRLSASEMASVIRRYGRKLMPPPFDEWKLDVIEVIGAMPMRWSVRVPLWTAEEGRSDLTLDLTVIKSREGMSVEMNDLHVL